MLLAIDIGNSNTVIGAFADTTLVAHWRIETRAARTSDEYAALLHSLFSLDDIKEKVSAGIVATVVPPALFAVDRFFSNVLAAPLLVVGAGLKTGMPILCDNPREVGADRIVNAVAAFERLRQGCIVVDFGTATTFDVVTPKGEYLGGAIAPGIHISADALYRAAAKLPRVEIARPPSVIGKNTVHSMQSGLLFGYVALVDGIVTRMQSELPFACKVIATGGLAPLIAKESNTIETSDEMLTLQGLRLIHARNSRDA